MARNTSKVNGEYLGYGVGHWIAKLAGASQLSAHLLINPGALDTGAADNRCFYLVIDGVTAFFNLNISGASSVVRIGGRSQTADSFQNATGTTTLTTVGGWYSVGGVIDYANSAIRVYQGGAQEANETGKSFGSSTLTDDGTPTGEDTLSSDSATTTRLFRGQMGEFSLYNGDIGSDGFAQLALRKSPLRVRRDILVGYAQCLGNSDPEPDLVDGGGLTINGSIEKASHPRVIRPSAKIYRFPTAVGAVVTGAASLTVSVTQTAAGTTTEVHEDFTAYTEVDPNSRITIDSFHKISFSGLLRNESAYVYDDKGAAFFNGDFSFSLETKITAGTSGEAALCFLSNDISDYGDHGPTSPRYDHVGVYARITGGGGHIIELSQADSATTTESGSPYVASVGTIYYLTFTRDESIGTYGTIYCYIYSDSTRTTLLDTLSLAIAGSKKDYRYVYALSSSDLGTSASITGYVQDLNLSAEAFVFGASSLSLSASISASGVGTFVGASSLSVSTTLASNAVLDVVGATDLDAIITLSASGVIEGIVEAAAALSTSIDVTASGVMIYAAASTLSNTASLLADGTVTIIQLAEASLSVSATLSATASFLWAAEVCPIDGWNEEAGLSDGWIVEAGLIDGWTEEGDC